MRGFFHIDHMIHMSHVLSLISPSKRSMFEKTKSLFFNIENLNELKGLVRMSASWSLVLKNQTFKTLLAT